MVLFIGWRLVLLCWQCFWFEIVWFKRGKKWGKCIRMGITVLKIVIWKGKLSALLSQIVFYGSTDVLAYNKISAHKTTSLPPQMTIWKIVIPLIYSRTLSLKMFRLTISLYEARHYKIYKISCISSKDSDQPLHPHSLINIHWDLRVLGYTRFECQVKTLNRLQMDRLVWVFNGCTCHFVFTAGSWYEPPHDKTNKMACAPSKSSDQPGHPPSLIRVFAVHSVGS